MTSIYEIQEFIAKTLKNDTEFNQKAEDELKSPLSYQIEADIEVGLENLPTVVVFGIEGDIPASKPDERIVQYILAAEYGRYSQDVDGIQVYPTKKILENLALDSISLIKKEMGAIGIQGNCNIKISQINWFLSHIGEADDIQAIVTLRFEEKKRL